jgi:hypothetical protein
MSESPGDQLSGDVAAMLQQRAQASQGWRPGCTNCTNNHKLAIMELTQKLGQRGMSPGSPEFAEQMQYAIQVGQAFAQNPLAFQSMNGDMPDMIPPIRGADIMVGGTGFCIFCFTPQKQTSLAIAPSGWHPGMGT